METFLPFFNRERKDKHRKKLELIYKYNQHNKAISDFLKNPELISNSLKEIYQGKKGTLTEQVHNYDAEYTQSHEYRVTVKNISAYISRNDDRHKPFNIYTELIIDRVIVGYKEHQGEIIEREFNTIGPDDDYLELVFDVDSYGSDKISKLYILPEPNEREAMRKAFDKLNFAFGIIKRDLDPEWPYSDAEDDEI